MNDNNQLKLRRPSSFLILEEGEQDYDGDTNSLDKSSKIISHEIESSTTCTILDMASHHGQIINNSNMVDRPRSW
jgi:hypothetical protein